MTRCIIKTWRGEYEVDLDTALTPDDTWPSDDSVARAKEAADLANKVLGRLLAELVERRVLSLGDAAEIAGVELREIKP